MSILDYGKIMFLLIDDLIEWLQSKKLLVVRLPVILPWTSRFEMMSKTRDGRAKVERQVHT